MIIKVYQMEQALVEQGDVVFAVFRSSAEFEPLEYQHAAIYIDEEIITIENPAHPIRVAEVVTSPDINTWPDQQRDYCVNLVGKVIKEEFGAEQRKKISVIANSIINTTQYILQTYSKRSCSWNIRKYKYVKPNPNNSDVIEELHFTCSGFVEYCYETAGIDIISDDPLCSDDHKQLEPQNCVTSPLPLTQFTDRGKSFWVHRLFPGYLIQAFKEDTYALDVSTSSNTTLQLYTHQE